MIDIDFYSGSFGGDAWCQRLRKSIRTDFFHRFGTTGCFFEINRVLWNELAISFYTSGFGGLHHTDSIPGVFQQGGQAACKKGLADAGVSSGNENAATHWNSGLAPMLSLNVILSRSSAEAKNLAFDSSTFAF